MPYNYGGGSGGGAVTSVEGRTGAVTIDKSDVELPNVDNTSDANKPVSTAQQAALDLKAPIANPTFAGTVAGITKAMVGLGNVDNTSDINKPVSTAQQAAINAAVTGLLELVGDTDCSTNPNYPAASKGDSFYVTVAGKIGGASGKSVEVGDVFAANADNAGGTEASVGTSWFVLEHNLVGAMVGANNLSEITNSASARTNLGLGTLATQNGTFSGTSSGTNTGDQTNISGNAATVTTNANLTGHVTSVGNATALGSFTVAQLNSAISDADVATGGGTATGINTGDQSLPTDATLSFTDITTNDVSITKHGFAPKLPNDAAKYLNGTGAYSIPGGGGDALVANTLDQFADVTQTATKTLAITESTTLAGGTHSGTNTGDQTTISGNSGSTNALKSATTDVNVSSATAPTVGQVLTATSSTAATWQTASGGGANTALSNLAAVAVNTTLVSDTDNTDDLGTATVRWKDCYLLTLSTGTAASSAVSLRARDVDGATWTNFLTLTANDTPTCTINGVTASSSFTPTVSNGAALGTSNLMWSDLFLASGAVIDFTNSNVTITHSPNTLAFAGATSGYTFTGGPVVPATNDAAALGTTSLGWSDLHLATGAVINFVAGDVTITHAANTLTFDGASTGYQFSGGPVTPATNDAAALGTATLSWSDLFFASGAVVNFNNGDVTITHSLNTLAFAGATTGYSFANGPIFPATNGTVVLGTPTLGWDDIHMSSGSTINFANGNAVFSHSSGIFTISTGDFRVTTAGTNTASCVTVGGTQTLTNKTLTAPRIASAGFLADANGNELIVFTTTASAVNEITYANAATTGHPSIKATGGDTNIGLLLAGKGTGKIRIGDGADNTKLMTIELVGATTAKTMTLTSSHTDNHTITLPNATDTLVGKATTDILTNKVIRPPVQSTTTAATVTPNADADKVVDVTAQAEALTIANPSGTPGNGQVLMIRIKDNGTARAITWGTAYTICGTTLPTTTVPSKRLACLFVYNTANSLNQWELMAANQEA